MRSVPAIFAFLFTSFVVSLGLYAAEYDVNWASTGDFEVIQQANDAAVDLWRGVL